jgi:hypothetical protein
MLFLAAITSSLSMLQPVIAFLEEGFGLKRHASASLLGIIALMGCCFVVYFSKDLKALDTMDFWVGTFLIFVLAMIQAVIYGWVFGIQRGSAEVHVGAHIPVPHIVQLLLKYVVPIYLIVIFVSFVWMNVFSHTDPETGERTPGYAEKIFRDYQTESGVALMSLIFIIGTTCFLMLMIHVAGKRWEEEGRFDHLQEE